MSIRKDLWSVVLVTLGVGLSAGCPGGGGVGSGNRNAPGHANTNGGVGDNVNAVLNDNASANQNAADNANGASNDNAADENQPPTAAISSHRPAFGDQVVTLDGTASSDPDGDPLSYAWEQISGPPVMLIDDDTAMPSFVAPLEAGTVVFRLVVSDGELNSEEALVGVLILATPLLFVANSATDGGTITGFFGPAGLSGNPSPDLVLSGAMTGLNAPLDLLVDGSGALLVLNFGGQNLTIYEEADGVTGDRPPSRTVGGAMALQGTPNSLALAVDASLLYVANFDSEIEVYDMVGTPAFDGDRPPVRTLTNAAMIDPLGLDFDQGDRLYVANTGMGGDPNVLVFDGAGGLSGDSPVRTITIATDPEIFAATLVDVFVDQQDRLYVVNSSQQRVFMFTSAATLDGMETPSATLTVPGAMELSAITVNDDGTGFIADRLANLIYVYENLASRDGLVPPDRTLGGADTLISNPVELYLRDF